MMNMKAKERLYLTASRDALVAAGDKRAAFLYCAPGDEIPDSAAKRFGLVDGGLKTSSADTLVGSSLLPEKVEIAAGKLVPIGNVVARAFKASKMAVDAWNSLPADDREKLLEGAIEAWKAEVSSPRSTRPRKTKAGKEQAPAENKEKPAGESKTAKPGQVKAASGPPPQS